MKLSRDPGNAMMLLVPRSNPELLQDGTRRGSAAMVPSLVLAAVLALIATLVATDWWAAWFAHPAVDPVLTRHGAVLWRIMLAITSATLAGAAWLLVRLSMGAAPTVRAGGDAPALSRSQMYVIAGAVALALVLRGLRINESLWYDEIASWRTYNGGVRGSGAVIGAFLDPINHVFHTLLNRWSVQWLLPHIGLEPAFRFPALMFSVFTVVMLFALGRAAGGIRVGALAAVLAAIAPVCVLEGVEGRGYSMMIFFSAAATWALVHAFTRRSAGMWLLYAAVCALGVWSHFVTAWIAIGHGAWLCWRLARRPGDRPACVQGLCALALAAVLSLTLYSPLIPGMLAWRANFFSDRGDEPRIFGPEGLHGLLELGGAWYWWAGLPGLLLFALGLWTARMRAPRHAGASLLSPRKILALALLGLPLMVLAVWISGSWLYARFMLFAMPGALLAIAFAIDWLWAWRRIAGIAALGILCASWLADLRLRPSKQPLREAMFYIQGQQQQPGPVLALGVAHDVLSIYGGDLDISHCYFFGRNVEDLAAKVDAVRPRWVVIEYPLRVSDETKAVLLRRGFRGVRRFEGWADWGQGDIIVMQRFESAPPLE